MERLGLNEDTTLYVELNNIYTQVNNVYYGYRRCYSKKPFEGRFDVTAVNEALHEYRKVVAKRNQCSMEKANQIIQQNLDKDYDDFTQFLCKCYFIKKHFNHESPLEHANATVVIEDCSRACGNQWVRHRIAAHSQASMRYIGESKPKVIKPKSIACIPECSEAFDNYVNQLPGIIEIFNKYNVPKEDARFLYPLGVVTSIQTTANWREWIHIFGERTCNRAQWEIRAIVTKFYQYFQEKIPFIFDDIAPKCLYQDKCKEHPSCGFYQIFKSQE